MNSDYEEQLRKALEKILSSKSPKKLIVAGPGTGKTYLFRKILEATPGDPKKRLVLTFLNNLKKELEEKLSEFAEVYTFHGYCRSLLHRVGDLRGGLSDAFEYFPGLATLIEDDWELNTGSPSPKFVGSMRNLADEERTTFYVERANFYDAVEFDDSVFRVRNALAANPSLDRKSVV